MGMEAIMVMWPKCGEQTFVSPTIFAAYKILALVCFTDRSKAVVPVLVFLFVALWFILEAICCMSFRVSFCSCVFQSF